MAFESFDKICKYFEGNPLRLNDAKEKGKKVVGSYCIYSPGELAIAADAIPVSLCGTRQDAIPAAETVLPRSLCPLIKSSYGFLLNDSCPYLSASDLVVGETTCDGKKKMFEIMSKDKNVVVLQLPSEQESITSLEIWKEQFRLLADRLENDLGVDITAERLLYGIDLINREKEALQRVFDTSKNIPAPATGMQLQELAFKTSFLPDKEEGIRLLHEVAEELEEKILRGESPYTAQTPRILLTGVPTGMGSHKVIKLLEECGANVTVIDNCTNYKKTKLGLKPAKNADKDEIYSMLAKRYLEIPCSIMSPNPGRYATVQQLADDFSVDAVVDLTWQGCHTYNIEAHSLKNFVSDKLGLPYLQLETDFSESDTEQLRVRIEAFLEMVQSRKSKTV
ncbi:2-hydroxyacyl-CoA dehydratase family protein [Desulfovibrio sp. OttesenSCG-928-C14]|nr:2-hydroxyacyl-CoA dehydratase family protein [Desulfovibrio sp. OttesenSCG-928-C14]